MEPLNLSCGQTDIYPPGLEAMSRRLPAPIYYPPFPDVVHTCVSRLRELMHTANEVLLITGSAIYGEEAAMNTVLEPGDLCVTVNAGVFGQVLTDLVRAVGCRVEEIVVRPGRTVTAAQVRSTLERCPEAKMLAMVHIETTAGTMNPVAEVGAMLKSDFPGVLFMVDAVSSLGSVPVRVDDWGIDICCSSSQKCLNAPQGIAIVSVSGRTWERIERRASPIPGLCLDLVTWRRWHAAVRAERESGQVDASDTAYKCVHGPSGSYVLLNALAASLDAIAAEGEERVLARHELAGQAFRDGVRAMGLRVLADEADAAPCSTCVVMSDTEFDVRRYMMTVWEEFGIATAGGSPSAAQYGYAGSRVGLMGFVAEPDSVFRLLAAMEFVLPRMGIPIVTGKAKDTAESVYAVAGQAR